VGFFEKPFVKAARALEVAFPGYEKEHFLVRALFPGGHERKTLSVLIKLFFQKRNLFKQGRTYSVSCKKSGKDEESGFFGKKHYPALGPALWKRGFRPIYDCSGGPAF
jgi:hypothetical protein